MTSLAINPNDFLHSLCKWMIARANTAIGGGTLSYQTPPYSLARNFITESTDAADPYTILRAYAGRPLLYSDRLPSLNVQATTVGTDDEAAFAQAQLFFESLLDADGLPLRDTTINGFKAADDSTNGTWRIVRINPMQRPGLITRDDRGRPSYVFNFETGFLKAS